MEDKYKITDTIQSNPTTNIPPIKRILLKILQIKQRAVDLNRDISFLLQADQLNKDLNLPAIYRNNKILSIKILAQVNRTKEIQEATQWTIWAKWTEEVIDGNKRKTIVVWDTKINLIKINIKTTLKCLATDKTQITNLELRNKWPITQHRRLVTTRKCLKWARNRSSNRKKMILEGKRNKVSKCLIICLSLPSTCPRIRKSAPPNPINWKFKEPPVLGEFLLIKLCWVTMFLLVFSNSNPFMKEMDRMWRTISWLNITK